MWRREVFCGLKCTVTGCMCTLFLFTYSYLYVSTFTFGLCTSALKGYCPTVFIHIKGWPQLPYNWHRFVRLSCAFDLALCRAEVLLDVKGRTGSVECTQWRLLKSSRMWSVVSVEFISSVWVTVGCQGLSDEWRRHTYAVWAVCPVQLTVAGSSGWSLGWWIFAVCVA
jgi:hypothetical protein